MATMNVRTLQLPDDAAARLGGALLAVAATVTVVALLCLSLLAVQHLARHHVVVTPSPAPGPVAARPQ